MDVFDKMKQVGDDWIPEKMNGADRFVVDDLAKAEWAMKKIAALQKDVEEKQEQAKRMKEEYASSVDAWLTSECESAQSDIEFFRSVLEPFIKAEIEKSNGKKKSIKLPSGSCGYRRQGMVFRMDGKVVDAENETMKGWLRENHAALIDMVTAEKMLWNEVKKRLVPLEDGRVMFDDGEIIEGLTAEEPEPTFYMKGK